MQIDHTSMAIVVVDELYRQPLGKPCLTLATDVTSRYVLGFVMSFVPPRASTVSLCLTTIVVPKMDWLRELRVASEWPMSGLPKALHLDGAAEFESKALKRGCAQYGIEQGSKAPLHARRGKASQRPLKRAGVSLLVLKVPRREPEATACGPAWADRQRFS